MKKKNILLIIAILLLSGIAACDEPPNPGFRVHCILIEVDIYGFLETSLQDGIGVTGSMIGGSAAPGATGNVTAFILNTGNNGYVDVNGGRAPADWRFGETSGDCAGKTLVDRILTPGEDYELKCQPVFLNFFTVMPPSIDIRYPPASVSIQGSGISAAGGMPMVEYYNLYGTLIAQQSATEVAGDGSWLSAPTPDLSSVNCGRYLLTIRNPDGAVAGTAFVDVYDSEFPPPPPPDPGDGNDCPRDMICPVEEPVS